MDDVMSWAEHADELEMDQLALALMRAYISEDESDLDAVTGRLGELLDETIADPETGRLGDFEAALVQTALLLAHRAFGDGLDGVLAEMQEDLREHVTKFGG